MDLFLSDFDSFSESSSSEDPYDAESVYSGQANCILSSLEETLGKIDDFLSFERGFLHGDIVHSITDPSGQMGRVINVDMIVDLENVHGNKVKDVNSKKLQKIRSISTGDYVVNGPWLGKVEKTVDRVTVLFDDGKKCEFTITGPEKLIPLPPDLLEDSQYPYYPGQRVQVELSSVSKSSRWLCGRNKEERDEGTVCAVDAGLVYVDWLGCALIGEVRVPAPQRLQDWMNLTLLSCFSHANWQIGDWCILPILDNHQSRKVFERNTRASFQEIFVISRTKTKVDVLWQDGSQSLRLDSHMLFPVNITDAHDFWPEQFVMEKGTCDDQHVSDIQKWGVVRCVDGKERTVRVRWEDFAVNQATDSDGGEMEETVSAYELVEHPDYSYCLGDAVFRLQKDQLGDVADINSCKNNVISKISTGVKNEYPANSFLSCIGMVVGFKDGDVEVKWANGFTTKVAPPDIFPVNKYEELFATPVLQDENVKESNEEMTGQVDHSLDQEEKGLLDFDGETEDYGKKSWDSSSFLLPRAAMSFLTSIASTLFGSLGPTSLSGSSDYVSEDEKESGILIEGKVLEHCHLCPVGPPLVVADSQTFTLSNAEQKVEETEENEDDLLLSSGSNCSEKFRQFDMISDCSDHHFVDGAGKGITSSQVGRGWLKKVHQEWSILEKDLPETIYVRIYEERMDLLRAAIIGAPGTPYHDALFIFDIFLPPEYPREPPLVHYNSGGLRVNPNLYESGRVCLSLLNTWTGNESEVWNPGGSTILQVLLSLQALVLNEKPYFNEAGYDKQMGRTEGEKNSLSYNENAFLVSCKSMLYLLRKPPKHFKELVEEHFSQRCKYILLACKAYMEGVQVGCAFVHKKAEQENQKGSSTGFKIMLAKIFPKLVEAFSDKGIDCSEYVEA